MVIIVFHEHRFMAREEAGNWPNAPDSYLGYDTRTATTAP
jgi:hypothetical protein